MCAECGYIKGHATMCPNGTPMVDVIYAECVLCGAEEDETEIYYGICEKCWKDHHNFDNALAYGASERGQQSIKVNGLFAKILTPDQINDALSFWTTVTIVSKLDFGAKMAIDFLRDDDGDFADWLKEQKNID